jgi:hypothetical protein
MRNWRRFQMLVSGRGACMKSLAIISFSIIAAAVYGVLHDQVTARICIEYFTEFHPPVFHTDSPSLLALGWGVYATWWMGAIFGIVLAIAARAGSRQRRDASDLIWPLISVLLTTGAVALLAGMAAFLLAKKEMLVLSPPLSQEVLPDRQTRFIAVLCAHWASYIVGALGGMVLVVRTWRSRRLA